MVKSFATPAPPAPWLLLLLRSYWVASCGAARAVPAVLVLVMMPTRPPSCMLGNLGLKLVVASDNSNGAWTEIAADFGTRQDLARSVINHQSSSFRDVFDPQFRVILVIPSIFRVRCVVTNVPCSGSRDGLR